MNLQTLHTEYELQLKNQAIPYPEYPRPQLKRNSFLNLNGIWDFKIENKGKIAYNGSILVPFCVESRISGVEREVHKGDMLVYTRNFTLSSDFVKDITLLHIDACDQECKVYINGNFAGENVGGYIPFSLDISSYVKIGENTVKIIATDNMRKYLPYGKQTAKRGGMWYTKVSGIWQTVWLESLPKDYISDIKITPDLNGVDITVFGGSEEKTVIFNGTEYNFTGESFRLNVENPIHWTPESPHLYDFTVISGKDRVDSYFALRTVGIVNKNGKSLLALNGKPYFFHGVLDQGYYSDGIFLPATVQGYIDDIEKMKSCGFNMLRKHIKIEPALFYYHCDKIGMAVFQDFVNSGRYSFILDTALPTIGIKKRIRFKAGKKRKYHFKQTALSTINLLYNHPSVVYYTIFNEGWGQHSAKEYYALCKAADNSRIYDTASGWFKVKSTDVESPHVYFKPIKLKQKEKPIILSEFGGYSYKIPNHSFNLTKNYGYRTYKTATELQQGIEDLYYKEIIPAIKNTNLSGAVITQLSDVEDETNGFLTYDRRVQKIPTQPLKDIADAIEKEFNK